MKSSGPERLGAGTVVGIDTARDPLAEGSVQVKSVPSTGVPPCQLITFVKTDPFAPIQQSSCAAAVL